MSVLLLVVGAIVAMAGVGMIGYGIPINEFSFGNTLIIAGTVAAIGGFIIIAIGFAVGQLQRIAETLATHTPVRTSKPLKAFEPPASVRPPGQPSQVPFPTRTKSEAPVREPLPPKDVLAPTAMPAEDHAAIAPVLQNPDTAVGVAEEYAIKQFEAVSLSPPQSMHTPVHGDSESPPAVGADAPTAEQRSNPPLDPPWRSAPSSPRPPQNSYFDAMWPAESRLAKHQKSAEFQAEPKPDLPPVPIPEAPSSEPPVAILKSGVVDGMGYTLYVDGSIEAELPQGTLRFASINELRGHLAKNA